MIGDLRAVEDSPMTMAERLFRIRIDSALER
jgi:hypothetical protein